MQLIDLVTTFDTVRATRSRKAKIAAIATCLRLAAHDEVFVVATYLSGSLTQRRTGVGWRSMTGLPEPAAGPSLTVLEVDAAFETLSGVGGAGSRPSADVCWTRSSAPRRPTSRRCCVAW